MKRLIFTLNLIVLLLQIARAQDPVWEINPADFNFDMTVTAVLNENCVELENPSNRLGAFVDGQMRGSVLSSTVVGGRYLTLLSVFSNLSSGEDVEFMIYNADTDEIIQAVTVLQFQDDAIFGTPSLPQEILTVNKPEEILLSNLVINENELAGTIVGNLSVVAGLGTYTYSLIDADQNENFAIVGSQLTTNDVLDFESSASQVIRIKAEETLGCFVENTFSISVIDQNDPPVNILLTNTRIDENLPVSTEVGQFAVQDQDGTTGVTFDLVSGDGDDDNTSFRIQGNKLQLAKTLDYETQNSYTIRVKVTDSEGAFFEKTFAIDLNDINDIPIGISISINTIQENNLKGQVIGLLSAEDQDIGDVHTFTFRDVPGNNNDQFVIIGNELRASTSFDFENINEYFIFISTYDSQGEEYFNLFSINVTDDNDTPTSVLLSNSTASESQPVGTFIGKFNSIDQDLNQSHLYQFVAGQGDLNNQDFTISNDSLFTNKTFDINAGNELFIRVESDDQNGGVISESFTIFINDVNNDPTDIILDNFLIFEDATISTTVGGFFTVDPDPGNGHTYSLVTGDGADDNASFIIIGDQLKTNQTFDFETKNTFSIRVQTKDNFGGSLEEIFVIEISNGNDDPTNVFLSNLEVNENETVGVYVATISTEDTDVADVHTYSFVDTDGNNNDRFLINGDQLLVNTSSDFETLNLLFITIQTKDGNGGTFQRQFTIEVVDSNEVPSDIHLSNSQVKEKQVLGTTIGIFSTTDIDAIDTHTYNLVAGNGSEDNSLFTINGNELLSAESFDFNSKNRCSILVETTDKGGLTYQEIFLIEVTNVNGVPTNVFINSNSIIENEDVGTVVGLLSTEDEDVDDQHTYALINGEGSEDNGSFDIINDSLVTSRIFNYEIEELFNIRIQTTDNSGNTFEEMIVINVNDQNEVPEGLDNTFNIDESAEIGLILGTAIAIESDRNQVLIYELINEDVPFAINPLTGELSLSSSTLNYEDQSIYNLEVLVEDNGIPTLSDTILLTIEVNDMIEGFLPSADYISPNGDDKNDYWVIDNVEIYDDYKLSIFDANGSIVYSLDRGYDNTWDGTYNGNDLPTGIYYYVLISNTNNENIFKGTISLVR